MKLGTRTRAHEAMHWLHTPTMYGRKACRARWHHRLHLIPGRILAWSCDRFDCHQEAEPARLTGLYEATGTTATGGHIDIHTDTPWVRCGCSACALTSSG